MTIFPEQRVPRPLPILANRTFASLDPSWCYRYTRFTNHQLQLLYELLNPPPRFNIHNGKCHCSSEEAFIITFVKLDKAQGLFQQPCLEQWKDNFPMFAGVIEHKLGEEAYGGLRL